MNATTTETDQGRGGVDPDEIARFNKLAGTWWDPSGPMWPLHRLNALRAPFVHETIANHFDRPVTEASLAGLTVLDIGCGAGLLSEAMARAGATVTGVDPAERNIEIARAHATTSGLTIEYINGSVEQIAERSFDVVLNMEVVEHGEDLPLFMQACGNRVAEGGMQVVATLNRNPKSWLFAIVGAEYVLRWLPRGTHQWGKFVKPEELETLLARSGLSVVRRAGVAVNPLTRQYSITDDTSVNYMLAATRNA